MEVARRAPNGCITGADPSQLMAEIALERNHELVMTCKVDVKIAHANALPFAGAAFDKVLCVRVVYF